MRELVICGEFNLQMAMNVVTKACHDIGRKTRYTKRTLNMVNIGLVSFIQNVLFISLIIFKKLLTNLEQLFLK